MKPTLFLLAAGMGSRFGGLKQIEPMGPSNEFIIDYSIYDAIKAGFNKVVFIIKEENFTVFKETIGKRVEPHINVEYVFQKNDNIPDEYKDTLRKELWDLGLNSAGIAVRFATDTKTLRVKWKSHNSFNMNHMTATGIRGLDLYTLQDDSTWTFLNSARPNLHKAVTTAKLASNLPDKGMREYMLY